jgi:hypothetical protein
MNRLFLIFVIALAVLVDGFFALVNFYPVAPARNRGPKRVVLMSLAPAEARWLRENLIAEFNDEHNANVELVTTDEEQLLPALAAPPDGLMLAALPRARGQEALAAHSVRSFEEIADRKKLTADLDGVNARVMEAARLDGEQVFLPRLARVDLMVFRQSRVRDAVRHWSLLRPQIEAALKARNGHGLPAAYSLELEPASWDSYDRFVIAYYWAHRRYGNEPATGRVAHRRGEQLDGIAELAETLYRAGATAQTLATIDSPATRDWLAWEKAYEEENLFGPDELWTPENDKADAAAKPIDDEEMLRLIRKDRLYLATIDQMEAFQLHGGSHTGTPPGVEDPDDLGFAPLPRMASLDLDANARPRREGRAFTFREDWVWALPAHGADAGLAYELVQFLWARENHVRECEALGTLPLRDDVQAERSSLFRLTWMADVFDAAFTLWDKAEPLPDTVEAGLGAVYAQLWERYVWKGQGTLDENLRAPPSPRRQARVARAVVYKNASEIPAPTSSDEDGLDVVDSELWHGKVDIDYPKAKAR